MAESLQKQVTRLNRKLEQISTKESARATSAALNKTVRRGRTLLSRSVARDVRVKVGEVRKRVSFSRSTAATQRAEIRMGVRDIPVISLISRSKIIRAIPRGTNKRGVRIPGHDFPGAFINPVHGGTSIQVLKRTSSKRYPLRVIKIPIRHAARYHFKRLLPVLMNNEYPRLLQHELNFRLEKYGRRT